MLLNPLPHSQSSPSICLFLPIALYFCLLSLLTCQFHSWQCAAGYPASLILHISLCVTFEHSHCCLMLKTTYSVFPNYQIRLYCHFKMADCDKPLLQQSLLSYYFQLKLLNLEEKIKQSNIFLIKIVIASIQKSFRFAAPVCRTAQFVKKFIKKQYNNNNYIVVK